MITDPLHEQPPQAAVIDAGQFRSLWENPVMIKEIRTRMRGGRAFAMVSVHLILLALIMAAVFLVFTASQTGPAALETRRYLGKVIFGLLIWMELIAISFTAPALTSGAISSEYERQTFDLLRVTLLTPARLVFGKYLSGLVFIVLLIFSSLPLQSLAVVIGGVLPQEIVIATLILMVTAVAFCAVGLFFSSLFSRVLFSTVLSYAFAIFLVFGIPLIGFFLIILFGSTLNLTSPNISPATQVFLIFLGWLVVSITPAATIIATESGLLSQQSVWAVYLEISNGVRVYMPSPWIAYVIFYLLVSLGLLWFSVQRVRSVET